MAYYESNLSSRGGITFIEYLKECRKIFKTCRRNRIAYPDISKLTNRHLADIGPWRDSITTKSLWHTVLGMISASAALLAGSLGFLAIQALPTSAAEPAVCQGSAYYCDQFAYNCTLSHGRFINFQPHSQRFVTYGCELPEHVSVDLFTGNLASTWLVPIGNDNNDDDSGSDPSDDPGQGTPNPTNPGGDDDIPGQDDPTGTID